MRLTKILLLASSWYLLCCSSGCDTESAPNSDVSENASKDASDHASQPGNSAAEQAPIFPVIPVATGPIVAPPPVGPQGGGGGSQGRLYPADTGNPDNDPLFLPETVCDDKLDNDDDNLFDCEDPDCFNKPCDDMNGCTVNDVCIVGGVCRGAPRDCEEEIGNECTIDTCEPIDMLTNSYRCVSVLDQSKTSYGSCTPDSNCQVQNPDGSCAQLNDECIVGRCVVDGEGGSQFFECQGADLVDLTEADTPRGCKDNNSCTGDMCKDGACMYFELNGNPCDDNNLCTTMDTCVMGDCLGMDTPTVCTSDADCSKGSTCTSVPGTCQIIIPFGVLAVGDPCFSDADCNASNNEVCEGESLGGCACDDDNSCTSPDTCGSGVCEGSVPETPLTCDDENPCTNDVCNGSAVCVSSNATNGITCIDDVPCTDAGACQDGECLAPANNANCSTGNACQQCTCDISLGCICEQITGQSDETCAITLTTLDLSTSVKDQLNALNISLSCLVGVISCDQGVEGSCTLSNLFAGTCSGTTLNTACSTAVFTLAGNANLVTDLCSELQGLTNP